MIRILFFYISLFICCDINAGLHFEPGSSHTVVFLAEAADDAFVHKSQFLLFEDSPEVFAIFDSGLIASYIGLDDLQIGDVLQLQRLEEAGDLGWIFDNPRTQQELYFWGSQVTSFQQTDVKIAVTYISGYSDLSEQLVILSDGKVAIGSFSWQPEDLLLLSSDWYGRGLALAFNQTQNDLREWMLLGRVQESLRVKVAAFPEKSHPFDSPELKLSNGQQWMLGYEHDCEYICWQPGEQLLLYPVTEQVPEERYWDRAGDLRVIKPSYAYAVNLDRNESVLLQREAD